MIEMRSRDIENRLESIRELARMMRNDENSGNWAKILAGEEAATSVSINFLQVEESETNVSLNRIIEKVWSHETSRGHDAWIDVRIDLDPAVPALVLDTVTVGRALANLVYEAIDHSPTGAPITIATHVRDDGATQLMVRDYEYVVRATDRRGGGDRRGHARGTDRKGANRRVADRRIGEERRYRLNDPAKGAILSMDDRLVIVRAMMERNGGTVSFASRPDGCGVVVSYGGSPYQRALGPTP